MKALIKKDVLVLTRQMKFFLLFIVVFSCMPGFSGATFAVLYSAMLPITALGYDENSHWDQLAAMMPYSPRQIVGSKYVLGLLALSAAAMLTLAAQLVIAVIRAQPPEGGTLETLAFSLVLSLLILSATLPFLFRFGVQKGRLYFLGIFALLFGAGVVGRDVMLAWLERLAPSSLSAGGWLVVAALIPLWLSYRLSVRLYAKRSW